MLTTRQCEGCGLTLVRRHYPEPPATSLAADYRDALARGFDPFELADACWEA